MASPSVYGGISVSTLGLLIGIASLAAPALAADCRTRELPAFDSNPSWSHAPLSKLKRDTVYTVVQEDGKAVLKASAWASASAYVNNSRYDIVETPMLEWSWRVPALIASAANEDPKREDAPVRMMVEFPGDKSTLPAEEQRRMSLANKFSSRELPFATLMYIWDNHNPVDMVIPSAHTNQVKMIVVESGPKNVGGWRNYRRNLVQDYQRAFGAPPQGPVGIGLMTDTDNTRETTEGFYGAIRFTCAEAK